MCSHWEQIRSFIVNTGSSLHSLSFESLLPLIKESDIIAITNNIELNYLRMNELFEKTEFSQYEFQVESHI